MDRLTNVQLERLVLALTDLTAALDVQATEEIARVGA